jgi:hypothetical protein
MSTPELHILYIVCENQYKELDKHTRAALRLVCKDLRYAVNNNVKNIKFSFAQEEEEEDTEIPNISTHTPNLVTELIKLESIVVESPDNEYDFGWGIDLRDVFLVAGGVSKLSRLQLTACVEITRIGELRKNGF